MTAVRARRCAPALALTVTLALIAGCSSGGTGAKASDAGVPTGLTAPELAAGAGHACIVGSGVPTVDWAGMRNPILSYPTAGVKDQAIVWAAGTWHMVFSDVTTDPALPDGVHWNIATATSRDLVHWSAASPWPPQAGTLGVASPDIVREPGGRFVVTYQSDPGGSSPRGLRIASTTGPRRTSSTGRGRARWPTPWLRRRGTG